MHLLYNKLREAAPGSGEGDGEAGVAEGVPREGGGDDEIIVEAGGRGVAVTTGGKGFDGVGGEFTEEGFIRQEGEFGAFDGEGEALDEVGLGGLGCHKGANGQAFGLKGFDVGRADAVGFGKDDGGLPVIVEGAEAAALVRPRELGEAIQRDHAAGADIEDDDGGGVGGATPIDTEDVTRAGDGLSGERGGGGGVDATENLTEIVGKFGEVFGAPDMFGGLGADDIEFGGVDEGVVGAGEMKVPPTALALDAHLIEMPEGVFAVGGGEKERAAAPIQEHGADDFRPDGGGHEGGFVEDDEIQPCPAQVIRRVGGADGDGTAAGEVEAAVGVVDAATGEMGGDGLHLFPDIGGHGVGGGEPPTFLTTGGGGEDGIEADEGFAETAATGDDAKTGAGFKNGLLVGMGRGQANQMFLASGQIQLQFGFHGRPPVGAGLWGTPSGRWRRRLLWGAWR